MKLCQKLIHNSITFLPNFLLFFKKHSWNFLKIFTKISVKFISRKFRSFLVNFPEIYLRYQNNFPNLVKYRLNFRIFTYVPENFFRLSKTTKKSSKFSENKFYRNFSENFKEIRDMFTKKVKNLVEIL